MPKLDWDKLSQEYQKISGELSYFRPLSEDDFKEFELCILTYGQMQSYVYEKYNAGLLISCLGDEEKKHELMILSYQLGYTGKEQIPEHLREFFPPLRNIIEEAIAAQEMSTSFVEAWGRYNFALGRYNELVTKLVTADKQFTNKFKEVRSKRLINEHWFAHWMIENAPDLKKKNRENVIETLGNLCFDIAKNKIPPFAPYPKEWFARMLSGYMKKGTKLSPAKLTPLLTDKYVKMPKTDIRKLVDDKTIPKRVLPPLSLQEYN